MALSKRQLLLLNNLMYMGNKPPMFNINDMDFGDETTVGEIVEAILANRKLFKDWKRKDEGLTTVQEWLDILEAVRSDPHLCDVQLVCTHTDTDYGGGGGESALFVDPADNEAILVFQGTAAHEWKDDFLAGTKTSGSADGVSSPQQENALKWFQSLDLDQYSSITVTGHSKGGNKAKYITLLDDSVTRCVSFDGQGFSDDFVDVYSEIIAQNQGKISNHNADYDYVNLILNDVGQTTYYKGHNIGEGGFIENHCPNTLFSVENGTLVMTETPRPHEMEVVDEYLNSMLRSIPEEKREEYLSIIGEAIEMGLGAGDWSGAAAYLLREENAECMGFVLGYTAAYIRDHPEAAESIRSVMDRFEMDDFIIFTYPVELLLHDETLVSILGLAGGSLGLSAEVLKWLRGVLEKLGLPTADLNEETLASIGFILFHASGTYRFVNTHNSGKDIQIPGVGAGIARFSVRPERMENAAMKLHGCAERIAGISEELHALVGQFSGLLRVLLYFKVVKRVDAIQRQAQTCEQLSTVLEECLSAYQQTELQIIDQF